MGFSPSDRIVRISDNINIGHFFGHGQFSRLGYARCKHNDIILNFISSYGEKKYDKKAFKTACVINIVDNYDFDHYDHLWGEVINNYLQFPFLFVYDTEFGVLDETKQKEIDNFLKEKKIKDFLIINTYTEYKKIEEWMLQFF